MTAQNLAAYLSGLQGIDLRFLAEAVTLAIRTDAAFPPVSRLIFLLGDARKAAVATFRERERALSANIGTVQCLYCMDAGFVRRDVMVHDPDFGRALPCPRCHGKANATRNSAATIQAHIERDHALHPSQAWEMPTEWPPDPPPAGFAQNVPIPETLGETQIAENRARIARDVAGISEKMRTMREREGTR